MTDLIERAKGALEGATPGPWSLSQETCYSGRMSGIYYRVWDNDLNAICAEEYGAHGDGGTANMRLIALSPDLARLAVAVREMLAEADALDEMALPSLAKVRAIAEGKE